MMSVTPQLAGSSGKMIEDCRDYLRTGRCKYGASCKYNHPPNVQNGGGLKPVDPSEPLFPSRPNEPICQYYLKHGTCKFGQACKFDHPPQNAMHVVAVGGQVQFMNMGHQMNNEPQAPTPLVLNPMVTDTNGMVLQFLPQRVDEPDCIYFLKNGRCKYGATCRYHHPVAPQGSRRVLESKPRRQPDPYSRGGQNVQYVAQMYPNYTPNRGIQAYDNSPTTFVNSDGNNGSSHSFQIVTGSDGITSYCIPTGSAVPTEPGSSASSIASSYEMSQEHMNDQWNRARRNGSGSSLNGVYANDGKPQRVFLTQSVSDGNIVPRQSRSTSYGSANEMNSSSLPRNIPAGSWNQRAQHMPYGIRQDTGNVSASPDPSQIQRRLVRRRDPRGPGHDEGFTMMTSALLNMLDTPEEAIGENISDDEYFYEGTVENEDVDQLDYNIFQRMSLQDQNDTRTTMSHDVTSSYVDRTSFEQVSMKAKYILSDKMSPSEETRTAETGQSWSPSWLGAVDGPDDTGFTFSLLPPSTPPTQSNDAEVGLYFP